MCIPSPPSTTTTTFYTPSLHHPVLHIPFRRVWFVKPLLILLYGLYAILHCLSILILLRFFYVVHVVFSTIHSTNLPTRIPSRASITPATIKTVFCCCCNCITEDGGGAYGLFWNDFEAAESRPVCADSMVIFKRSICSWKGGGRRGWIRLSHINRYIQV